MTKKQVKTAKTVKKAARVTPVAVTPAPKSKKTGTKAMPAPVAIAEPASKRVTPGAAISEWRVVPSQRKGQPGYFLQGGNYQLHANGRNAFTVGSETFFDGRAAAQAALVAAKTRSAAA